MILNDRRIEIQASPFSQAFEETGRLGFVKSLEELEMTNCQNCILVVGGKLAEMPLQPKEYPFYYTDEHRYLIELFEGKQPAAIIAATGKHALCGLQPFPLFEDGNFLIPSAYLPETMFEELQANGKEGMARVSIHTKNRQKTVISLWLRQGTKAIRAESLYAHIWIRSIIRKEHLIMQSGSLCYWKLQQGLRI